MSHEVVFLEDEAKLAAEAAATLVDRATRSMDERGAFVCALPGGTTPRAMYRLLADVIAAPPLSHATFVVGDERAVPPVSPESNYRAIRDLLFSRLPPGVRPNLLRIEAERPDRDSAAREFEGVLRSVVPGDPPAIDLVVLGVGADGHTAGVFPGSPLLEDDGGRLVAADYVKPLRMWRVTLTPTALRAARERLFLVNNAAKRMIIAAALAPDSDLPAARVGEGRWLLAPARAFRESVPVGVREAKALA